MTASTYNEINSEKITKPIRVFICRWGATHRKIEDLSICPPNIILDLFCLLFIPYSCFKLFLTYFRKVYQEFTLTPVELTAELKMRIIAHIDFY